MEDLRVLGESRIGSKTVVKDGTDWNWERCGGSEIVFVYHGRRD